MLTQKSSSVIYPEIRERLAKQGYQLSGKQIAVKKCLWTHNYLREGRYCYKATYGIQSHRCIQATPTLLCNHQCLFCWRLQEKDLGLKPIWNAKKSEFDSPEEVYQGLLWGWKKIISGYKPDTEKQKFEEAMNPKHVALSLAGEPTLYPFMTDLLLFLKEKGFTTFLVSNGTNPEMFEEMIEKGVSPTQLYITIPAPDKKNYLKTCRPLIRDGWARINKSLKVMAKMTGRTVARLTMARKINMIQPKDYVPLIREVNPSFIEIKGFVPVGFSQYRVTRANMPFIEHIRAFAEQILDEMSEYKLVAEKEDSKVVIMANDTQPLKIPGTVI